MNRNELNDEQLENVSGGEGAYNPTYRVSCSQCDMSGDYKDRNDAIHRVDIHNSANPGHHATWDIIS